MIFRTSEVALTEYNCPNLSRQDIAIYLSWHFAVMSSSYQTALCSFMKRQWCGFVCFYVQFSNSELGFSASSYIYFPNIPDRLSILFRLPLYSSTSRGRNILRGERILLFQFANQVCTVETWKLENTLG